MGLLLAAHFVNLPITDGISGYKPSTVLTAKKRTNMINESFPLQEERAQCVCASQSKRDNRTGI